MAANATRIRWIAFAVIAGELARSASVFFENRYVMTHVAVEDAARRRRDHDERVRAGTRRMTDRDVIPTRLGSARVRIAVLVR